MPLPTDMSFDFNYLATVGSANYSNSFNYYKKNK
ncbi:unknown [Prevotella sp. CAG:1124]|nr:unknown [Prevotella sp. CAG:1124]